MLTIKVKYIAKDVYEENPLSFTGGRGKSCWVDVRAAEDCVIKQGDERLIPLGFAARLPENYEAILAPRSSSSKKFGFIQANSIGVIDDSYCGNDDEWKLSVYGIHDAVIHKGDRVAQFRIQEKMPDVMFEAVEDLGTTSRGGFGSSGVK